MKTFHPRAYAQITLTETNDPIYENNNIHSPFFCNRTESACRTPRGEVGECLNLKTSCPELLNLLTAMPRKPEDIEYLRRSQCGFVNSDPLVCCPVRQWEQPTVQPTRPPVTIPDNTGNVNPSSRLLPEDCGKDLSNRIVGGNITDIDEFPWMVLLEYRKCK